MADVDWTRLVNTRDATPLHAQLERGIRVAIASGRLKAGDQLPTVRQLAVDLRINANTVAKVYAHLERSGTLETRRGVGTFVIDAADATGHQAVREEDLRAIAMRALAEASEHGFTAADLRRELNALTKGAAS